MFQAQWQSRAILIVNRANTSEWTITTLTFPNPKLLQSRRQMTPLQDVDILGRANNSNKITFAAIIFLMKLFYIWVIKK